MNAFDALNMRGIAIVGRTGSGKSTLFHGSEYVLDVCITDTGSMGHFPHHRGGGQVHIITPTDMTQSPIEFVKQWVAKCEAEKRLWCLDSWSALEWQQCAWHKLKFNRPQMNKADHNTVVNQLRDLALTLALSHGFCLFNTGNGGVIQIDGEPPIHMPKGTLTGYPSLNGTTPGKETILARWSTVWVLIPGTPDKSPEEPSRTPRGFLLDHDDFRGADYGHYVPLKDGYGIMAPGTVLPVGTDIALSTRVNPVVRGERAPIDILIERIMAKQPQPAPTAKGRKRKTDEVSNGYGKEYESPPETVG